MQARLPAAARDSDGLLFDRYRLLERLGLGGTAEVWRAHDERLQRDVAVKLLHRHLLPDERSRARFLHEARAVAALNHPGVLAIHDVIVDDDQAALVLELVDGRSLGGWIAASGALPPVAAAGITAQVAAALGAAHASGIVHRDVKPDNVIVSPDGRARIVDFGIASAGEGDGVTLTAPGSVMGTLRYMAPEQLAGSGATTATDVFGLGSLLYMMLAGAPPFAGLTPAVLASGQQSGAAPIPGADPELEGLARRALAVDPASRPASADVLLAELDEWLARHALSRGEVPAAVAAALAAPPANELPVSADTGAVTLALTNPVRPVSPASALGRDWMRRLPPAAPYLLAGLLLLAIAGAAFGNFGSTPGSGAAVDAVASPTPNASATPSVVPAPSPTVVVAPVRAEPNAKPAKPDKDEKKKKGG